MDQQLSPIKMYMDPEPAQVREQDQQYLAFWLQSSLRRVYPNSQPVGGATLSLLTARNARLSFQACLRNHTTSVMDFTCLVDSESDIEIQVRRVGYVPQLSHTRATPISELEGVSHVPGFVPDPLFPENNAKVTRFVNQAFWVTLKVPTGIQPGMHTLTVRFGSPSLPQEVTLTTNLNVADVVIKPRQGFPITQWWNADCLYDWYKSEPFGERFWEILRPYLQNMREHASDVIFVPLWNIRREPVRRPPQLLEVSETAPGQYKYGWDQVRRFVRLAKELGFEWFEWSHIWAYSSDKKRAASVDTTMTVYTRKNGALERLFPPDLPATSPIFRNYLEQFIGELKQFLIEEGILEKSLFHVSDESGTRPLDIENYRRARALLKELAPWAKVLDAVYDPVYAAEDMCDYPCPNARWAEKFLEKNLPHWVYYCISPNGPYINRFFDTPMTKIRAQGLIFYHMRTLGFLHWGYNYWYVMNFGFNPESQVMLDPFSDASAGGPQPYGDPFVVYPGPDGPIDSIRWEVFAEAMQDYALLQTLAIDPDDRRLQAIRNYGDFPKSEQWLNDTLESFLSGVTQARP